MLACNDAPRRSVRLMVPWVLTWVRECRLLSSALTRTRADTVGTRRRAWRWLLALLDFALTRRQCTEHTAASFVLRRGSCVPALPPWASRALCHEWAPSACRRRSTAGRGGSA